MKRSARGSAIGSGSGRRCDDEHEVDVRDDEDGREGGQGIVARDRDGARVRERDSDGNRTGDRVEGRTVGAAVTVALLDGLPRDVGTNDRDTGEPDPEPSVTWSGTEATPTRAPLAPALLHGRAVAAAMRAVCPAIRIVAFPVFDGRLSASRATLRRALREALDSDADILHCSFGFREPDEGTRALFARAVARFALVVASAPARGERVFPAAWPGVVGASGDARCTGDEYSRLGTPTVDFAACPRVAAHAPAGASVGAARVTGFAARLVGQGLRGRGALLERLAAGARFVGPESRRAPHRAARAARRRC